jgi:3-dehydroquinate synthase
MPEAESHTVRVDLPGREYDVVVGEGLLADSGAKIAALGFGNRLAVVSDSNVAPLYSGPLLESLSSAGFEPSLHTVPAGEASKSVSVVEEVCREMIRAGHDRSSALVALGGGVVGDLAGFVAAIFYRGIPFVQIPTTIVSQIDSSVGGKTGVNAPEGKNLIGAFHQPRLVLADTETLASLPAREFNEGFAEVIKHAAIRDGEMLDDIMKVGGPRGLGSLVARNVAIKARVVEDDERETSGTRAHLNYGHTIGHAIEAAGGYGRFLHGEAISLGLVAAGRISSQKVGLGVDSAQRVNAALQKFDLPTQLPADIGTDQILDLMKTDKKFAGGQIRFVVVPELGSAELRSDITEEEITAAIEALR